MFGSLSVILSGNFTNTLICLYVCVCERVTCSFICESTVTNTNEKPGALTLLKSLLIIYPHIGYVSLTEVGHVLYAIQRNIHTYIQTYVYIFVIVRI